MSRPPPDAAPEPFAVPGLLSGGWRDATFEPFREGVEICHLLRGEPALALLRYAPGAGVPAHAHPGLETILVLEGAQTDERGRREAGALVVNTPGSSHSVWSDEGCVVLIQWTKPVAFLDV
ncbi:cupin domain-containing protein [Rubrimonas cliftonensis]|uniref:Anti-ECFsigma factor, ChrR n=1 Tax=Rubrimonas cliftonensis TaxID=89524 RepID=A0A1H4B696_9RHOB|nr:cupin domain-containing protein [Rubrimonas cliftonensis]SEA43554.1 anti-ECFsigma factor, ChrR [Rubrimonas cliftonensis]